ncbi:MAG: potassium-transporting ATPase subunit B, partial [Thiobacillus sp.]|nr:potassium-transporting ATPase subunit B [Thiobacillus sp.]
MHKTQSLYDAALIKVAAWDAVKRLSPRHQVKNPVMFVVWLGSLLTTGLFVQALVGQGEAPAGFILAVSLWLWFTVLFANFAEAMAEGRGKAQAAALKGMKRTVLAKKLKEPRHDAATHVVNSEDLRKGDVVLVTAGETIPGDGEVIEGVASVDESAIT